MAKHKMAYGFHTPRKYLLRKGSELGIVVENPDIPDPDINIVPLTIDRLICDAGLKWPRRARRVLIYTDKERINFDHAIVLATTDPDYYGLPRDPPPRDVIDRLKEVLGVTHEPTWFFTNTSYD